MMVSLFLVPAKLLLETFDTNKQSSLSRSKYNANYKNLKRADQIIGLRDVAIDSEQQRHQIYAIRLLAKRYPEDCVPALRVIATRRIATEVRRIATICLAVTRSESNRSFFSRLIEDQDVAPQLREAAIDGLGLLQTPNRSLETYRVQSDPVVDLIDLAHPSLQPDRSGQYVWRDGKGVMGTKPPSYQPLPTWHEKPNDLRKDINCGWRSGVFGLIPREAWS